MKSPTLLFFTVSHATAFTFYHPPFLSQSRSTSTNNKRSHLTELDATGVFFGTSTGCTEEVAEKLVNRINEVNGAGSAEGPFPVDDLKGSLSERFASFDSLLLGTPTWNTDAEKQRSGTGWDELYYADEMEGMKADQSALKGKRVGVFGLGDMSSYGENYADASGELHDVVLSLGMDTKGTHTTIDDSYTHDASKAIVDGKWCGLMCDEVNQADLTEKRVGAWVEQLKGDGFFAAGGGGGGGSSAAAASTPPPTKIIDAEPVVRVQAAAAAAAAPKAVVAAASSGESNWVGHPNAKKGSTLWINKNNGRESFITKDKA
jgi:flavodoxin I